MNLKWIAVLMILFSLLVAGCVSDNDQDDTDGNISEGEQNETIDEGTPEFDNETPVDEETPVIDNETPVEDGTGSGVTVVPSTDPSTYTIRLENFLALPANLTINPGDSVVWINFNSPTRNFVLISNDELWEHQTIGYRGRYVHTFNETGTYTYKIQGYEERMKGTINVI
jgi:plastocyanin